MTPMLAEHERNPDIIPINSRDSKLEAEEGGFGVYGEKTRYASLQKKRDVNAPASQRGYETMRNLRTSIPSLSQEVTYAELSLPRNKGYAPMRSCNINAPAPNLAVTQPMMLNSVEPPPVIYARIDHSSKRNYNQGVGPSMMSQAHTTVPLLITNNSG